MPARKACPVRKCGPDKWTRCATCPSHKGDLHRYLHRYLGVPKDAKITHYPCRKLLVRIKRTAIGKKVVCKKNHRSVTVTRRLKGMVMFALNTNPV